MKVCEDATIGQKNAFDSMGQNSESGELWIQALTYFRDRTSAVSDRESEDFLLRALDFIEGHNVLSPLLVLEILAEKKDLKFRVLKKFMKLKLKAQSEVIKRKKQAVETIRNEIVDNQQQTIQMKTTAINFEQKECAECK